MSSPIWASSMLKTAQRLAGTNSGPGRPALCDLRRATSTAYYALFHQITRHGVFASVPSAEEEEVARIARWFTHTGIRQACAWVQVASSPRAPKQQDREAVDLLRRYPRQPVPHQLVLVADSFVELQNARHDADYSNDYDPNRPVTLDHVLTADAAIRATWSMWTAQESTRPARIEVHDAYRRFLQLAMLKSGGPRAR